MTETKHSPALDGLRGLAIALVIASHAFPMIPELPWTVKRFTNLGFYGVQLFFVVSALTLAASWRRAARTGPPSPAAFAIRRVFRIAPGYFLAACLYARLNPAPALPVARWLTFLTFTNGFSPAHMPTADCAYTIVPGGWSIEAEFGFYAIFPLLVTRLRTPAALALGLAACLPLAWLANAGARTAYLPVFGFRATDQFQYYWLPTQLPVFLLGLLVGALSTREAVLAFAARHAQRMSLVAAAGFFGLGLLPWPRLPVISHLWVASPYLAAACFAALTLAAVGRPPAWLTHWLVVALGQASFSAYLLHFAVLDAIRAAAPAAWLRQTGVGACVAAGLVFVAALVATGLLSQVTYRLLELPFMRLGGKLAEAVSPRRVAPSADVNRTVFARTATGSEEAR